MLYERAVARSRTHRDSKEGRSAPDQGISAGRFNVEKAPRKTRKHGSPLFLLVKQALPSALEPYAGASKWNSHAERVIEGSYLCKLQATRSPDASQHFAEISMSASCET